ncbi:HD domain-containing protein [Methanobacterium sp.]|uniref:HD domain-containing protein n=1 Tax=Methanobacterium sp. TaxID=2164 RepID=UPI003D65944D
MVIMVMEKMIEYFQSDVRRINHALKVFDFTQIIAEDLDLDNETKEIIFYSAILHDIGIKNAEEKYSSSAAKYQELEGPIVAREILKSLNIPEKHVDRGMFYSGKPSFLQ